MNKRLPLKELQSLAKSFDLDLLILFGSEAKGKAKEESDIDLAFFKKNMNEEEEFSFFEELEKLLLPKEFDLINLNTMLSEYLKYEIFWKGDCLFQKEKGFFQKEKEIAFFNYMDSKILLEPSQKKFLKTPLTNG